MDNPDDQRPDGNGISEGRKTAYYVGGTLMAIGGLMFLSTFVLAIADFGNFNDFQGKATRTFGLAFGGMVLLVIGGIVRGIGARGVAGSGLKLDPEQARRDLEPYSKMAGGMVGDALAEIKPQLPGAEKTVVVKVKCTKCGALNDEAAKFCDQCGAAL